MRKEDILKHARLQHIPSGYLEAIDIDPDSDIETSVARIASGYQNLMKDLCRAGILDEDEIPQPEKKFDKVAFDKYLDEHFPKSSKV